MIDGYVFLEKLNWENDNESVDLIKQLKPHKECFGCYPESLHADKIYRTRGNMRYCKEHGIRFSGKPLGRPPKVDDLSPLERKMLRDQRKQDEGYRNGVEGRFGQGKRRFSLARIMPKRADAGEVVIAICLLVMNLEEILRYLFWPLLISCIKAV